jgi:osmotically-inducible protein OsmY
MPERYWDRERDWDRDRRYRGEGYYGGAPEHSGDRERYPGDRGRGAEYDRRGAERGFLERAGDEVRSWFGDDDATRRRTRDERETGRWGGGAEDVDPDWARQWGYLEGRGQRGPERGAARGWGHGGGSGAGPGYVRESGYGSPRTGWGWSAPERAAGPRSGMSRGPFAGRGPRGYQRSDERIREDICERMCDNDELDASEIDILVVGGEVTLQGSVRDRYDKHLAEDLVEQVSGVREVNNQLRISQGTRGQQGQPPQNPPGDQPRYRAA